MSKGTLKRGDLVFIMNEGLVSVGGFVSHKKGFFVLSSDEGFIVVDEASVFLTRDEAQDAACEFINDKIDEIIKRNRINIKPSNEEFIRTYIEKKIFSAHTGPITISASELERINSICA